VLTSISRVIFRTFRCDDDFDHPSEAAHSPFYNRSYLFVDYSVSCKSARYRVHAAYAILCVCIYPIGIPLSYLFALISVKPIIAPSNVGDLAHSVVQKGKSEGSWLREEVDHEPDCVDETKGTMVDQADNWTRPRLLAESYLTEQDAIEHVAQKAVALTAPNPKPLIADEVPDSLHVDVKRLQVVGYELIHTTRTAHPDCHATSFLFCDTRPSAWYYEIVDAAERLTLTCLLPLPWAAPNAVLQHAAGAILSVGFMVINALVRPFKSPIVGCFSLFTHFVVSTNFIILWLLYDDANLEGDTDAGINRKVLGFCAVVLNAALMPICAFIAVGLEAGVDARRVRWILSKFQCDAHALT